LNGPSRVPVVNAVDDTAEILEGVRVGEEGRKEVNLVISSELVDGLGLPTIDGGVGAKGSSFVRADLVSFTLAARAFRSL
jgi:hypothetical protein